MKKAGNIVLGGLALALAVGTSLAAIKENKIQQVSALSTVSGIYKKVVDASTLAVKGPF